MWSHENACTRSRPRATSSERIASSVSTRSISRARSCSLVGSKSSAASPETSGIDQARAAGVTVMFAPLVLLTHKQVTAGHMGFLITASYERSKTTWSYMKKRICGIYPGFIVAMLRCAFVALPAGGGRLYASSTASRAFDFVTQTIQLRDFHYAGVFPNNPTPPGF